MTGRRLGAAFLTSVVGAAFLLGTQPVAAKTQTVTNALQRFTPLYMATGSKPTETEAVAMAKDYDLIAEHAEVLTPYFAAMKAAEPSLKVVAYINGAFDQSKRGRSVSGVLVRERREGQRSGQVLRQLADAARAAVGVHRSSFEQDHRTSQYDGCFLDTLGIAPLPPGYVTGSPINPATHEVFTPQAWIADQANTITATKKGNPGKTIMANGLHDGSKFSITQPLLTAGGTGMAEVWLRVSTNKEDLVAVAVGLERGREHARHRRLERRGHRRHHEALDECNRCTDHAVAYLHYLHVPDGHQRSELVLLHVGEDGCRDERDRAPMDNTAIGDADRCNDIEERRVLAGTFSNGIAAVNPGASSVTIQLGGSYVNLEGKTVRAETLAPHSGDVFIK